MKNCVLYGAWLNNNLLNDIYLSTIIPRLSDCDFYVGFNHSTSESFKKDCLAKAPVVSHATCPKHLEAMSDASAYQTALKVYKENKKEQYKNIFFVHNKGASHPHPNYINDYLVKFLRNRQEAETILEQKEYGGYCLYGGICNDMSTYWNNLIKDTSKFSYDKPMDVMWWCTIYVIKAEIVDKYLENIDTNFFETKLDKYFFEASFPLICDKFGYLRYTKEYWDHPSKFTTAGLQLKLKEYNDINKLAHIMSM